jgi:hypothetical protein
VTNDHGMRVESSRAPSQASAPEVAVAAPGAEPVSYGVLQGIRTWIVDHDESKLFLGLYVGLAVVLSIWISLFWLLAVVAVHFGFELIRQSHRHAGTDRVVIEALWELKLDVALILFALMLTLYMDLVLGVAGLSGAARMGAASRAAARFAGWERTLRGLLLSVDDAAQVVRATTVRRRGLSSAAAAGSAEAGSAETGAAEAAGEQQAARTSRSRWGGWAEPYSTGTWIALGLAAVCTALIVAAPWLTPHTAASALQALAAELRPLP